MLAVATHTPRRGRNNLWFVRLINIIALQPTRPVGDETIRSGKVTAAGVELQPTRPVGDETLINLLGMFKWRFVATHTPRRGRNSELKWY